ncbi:RagB/SusD family nutrient uptake outer membrane protein [Pontibacter korlensis]|uniref:RagB/SusD family protein n=1 Tax=Pontibacter korlensis TaxID=400092 RepID=A0A0E3ZJ30_9BACT|nr:RagB/SusD family nutrient uptake outer membrane protein [Pontibacter korlensis]AKD05385.1 RagB/SusD family protein [Pontibacter korlensis]
MKKKIYTLTSAIILAAGMSACEEKLDLAPVSEVGSNGFYKNTADFEKAVTGVYSQLRGYPMVHFDLSEVRSDNIYAPGTSGIRDYNLVNNFNRTLATNAQMSRAWNSNYNGIMRANTVIEKLSADAVPDEALRTRFEAEAKFLRAMYYFDLVRWFGRVPLFDRSLSPLEALEVPRSPVEDVYNLILADLQFAVENLPESYGADNVGRATSHAARGILARVYLTRSGPELHPDGPTLGTDEYTQALQLLNEIINSGRFAMLSDYDRIFAYDNENNSEIVFDIQYRSGGQGLGGEYVQGHYSEPYARAVGIPFAGGTPPDGPKTPSDGLLASFGEGDLRVAASIQQGYTDQNGNPSSESFINKYLDLNHLGVDRFDFELNFPVIRYTDVLMMKAEALLKTGGGQAEVDEIVNAVRTRAGLEPVANVTYEELMEERRKEFVGEGLRWHDLVRSGLVLDVMNAWIAEEDADEQKMAQNVVNFDIIYAIPQNQLDVKTGLYDQNPGY